MKRTGFTLIELLVVIAVIALLMALTSAALRMARAQARAVVCESNVKQLALGLLMYADQNETFPHGFRNDFSLKAGYLGNAETDPMGRWWLNEIENFARKSASKERVFYCPSKKLSSPKLQGNILWGNYGVNRSICRTLPSSRIPHKREFTGTPLGRAGIPHPSRTLLIVDSGCSLVDWRHVTDVPPMPLSSFGADLSYVPGLEINAGRLLPAQLWDAINGRHPNKTVNFGSADGHVSRIKAQDLTIENAAETCKNKTPLWVPKETPVQ